MGSVPKVVGNEGRVFRVGEKLPNDVYTLPEGMMAAIVNDMIPEGVFILVHQYTIVQILDTRDEEEDVGILRIDVTNPEMPVDAIGMSPHDFMVNQSRLGTPVSEDAKDARQTRH